MARRAVRAESDGHALSAPEEPDRALLAALAAELAEVDAHRDLLPDRLHVDWLESILGIRRLPVVPDRVVAQVTVDPKVAPAVVPLGTRLRGGKDAAGNERRYRTLDALTAHGAGSPVSERWCPAARPRHAGRRPDRARLPDGAAEHRREGGHGSPAEHLLRVHAPALAFADGDMMATFTFGGVVGAAAAALSACAPTACGDTRELTARCHPASPAPAAARRHAPALRRLPRPGRRRPVGRVLVAGDPAAARGLGFTGHGDGHRTEGMLPDACFANEGAVDVAKEFEPFLTTARAATPSTCGATRPSRSAWPPSTLPSRTSRPRPGASGRERALEWSTPSCRGSQASKPTSRRCRTPAKNKFGFSVGDLWAHPWSPSATVLRWQRRTVDGDWQASGPH